MSREKPRNVAASVRQRLSDLAKRRGDDFQFLMTRYVIERLLYRLSVCESGAEFVLKGAVLFQLWTDQPHRPTRDLDLLGMGSDSVERLADVFKAICVQTVEDDGLIFDVDEVRAERIKEDQEYQAVRVHCQVRLGQARTDLQIDVGFGDAITPAPVRVEFPTILAFPAPVLRAYTRQTVVAEKFQAMVVLGLANSRMKDFFDLWVLAREFEFDGTALQRAVAATFQRRKTPLPIEPPLALTKEFGTDAAKIRQWQGFIRKSRLDSDEVTLEQVCAALNEFLMPLAEATASEQMFEKTWLPRGPWLAKSRPIA